MSITAYNKTMPKRRKQNSGQLAIFIALIFQLVFILFAMSLNVALVVHDKINLQNSVDLAAYYGAMKQAQTLNAIAHINYQIRQSWKLLAWRYRIMGNPYPTTKAPFPGPQENSKYFPNTGATKIYLFCTAAYNASNNVGWGAFRIPRSGGDERWEPTNGGDHAFCKNPTLHIRPLSVPSASAPYIQPLVDAIRGVVETGELKIEEGCKAYSYTNWLFALFSLYHFRVDQSRKAKLIYKIAEQIAGAGKEIERTGTIEAGARKTFQENLTYINRQVYDSNPNRFQPFNSLKGQSPNNWLSSESFFILPPLYIKTNYSSTIGCKAEGAYINSIPNDVSHSSPAHSLFIQLATNDLISFSSNTSLCQETGSNNNNLCESSAGLSKKDGFIVYFGAKAELQYENQIFLPFFTNHKLTLKAQAFAKPFGGRIGPKYEDDLNLPKILNSLPTGLSLQFVSKNSPNYAKYPGDKYGLTSHYTQKQWVAKIYNATNTQKSIENYIPAPGAPPLTPLSEGSESRQWELAAVAPDLFDVTYFTILPSYMETYYKNLRDIWSFDPPPDFGGGIRQQVPGPGEAPVWPVSNLGVDKPFYVIENLSHLLTGWNPPKQKYKIPDEYLAVESETLFAKCDKWDYQIDADGDARMATGCITGGRTGYSVKMIHKEDLQRIMGGGSTPSPSGSGWNW